MEMGTGKSKVAIDDMGVWLMAGEINAVLITAGAGSYLDWVAKHIPENMPADVPHEILEWSSPTDNQERRMRERIRRPVRGVLLILVVNIEALGTSPRAQRLVTEFVSRHRVYAIIDESTTIKNHESRRVEFLESIRGHIPVRRIMTGSPITQNPLDLWGQYMFLGTELLGSSNYFAFRAKYAVTKTMETRPRKSKDGKRDIPGRRISVVVGFRNVDELKEKLKESSYRVLKEECLDLPPKIYEYCDVEMTDQQAMMYDEMKRYASAMIGEGVYMTAESAITQLIRLQQLLCGWARADDGQLIRVPTNRVDRLLDVLDETDSAIVWCSYRNSVDDVIEAIDRRHGKGSALRYDGSVPPRQRPQVVADFQNKKAPFFVGTQAAGARGITLTRTGTVVYYSNTPNLEHRLQSEDRAHRDGQTRAVTYVDLRTRGTIDDRWIKLLKEKVDIASTVLGDTLKEWLK